MYYIVWDGKNYVPTFQLFTSIWNYIKVHVPHQKIIMKGWFKKQEHILKNFNKISEIATNPVHEP